MDMLLLENQLCFPLYVASKEIIRKYKEFLDPLDLTYTQYIVMMVLWEEEVINVKHLGEKVYLDSGTYLKSFYSVMGMPSAVRIQEMGDKNKRIHHAVEWESCVPMILNECYKKRSEMNGE